MHAAVTIAVDTFAGVGLLVTALFIAGVFLSRRRKSNR